MGVVLVDGLVIVILVQDDTSGAVARAAAAASSSATTAYIVALACFVCALICAWMVEAVGALVCGG